MRLRFPFDEDFMDEWMPPVSRALVKLLPLGVLIAVCLWAIDWRKAWAALADGGWIALVLIGLVSAAAWAFVWPTPRFGIQNGFWQLGAVALIIGLVLLCGWVQTRWGYVPPQFDLDEPAHAHGHHEHHHEHHVGHH